MATSSEGKYIRVRSPKSIEKTVLSLLNRTNIFLSVGLKLQNLMGYLKNAWKLSGK
jgi:hypothetical protein